MNEFTAKKIGEVLAFSKVLEDTVTKAKTSFLLIMSDDDVEVLLKRNIEHIVKISEFAKNNNVGDIVEEKSDKTAKKLRAMRDMYIGDEWENPSEVFEWWGFFGGAAIAHWNLVKGITQTFENDAMGDVVYDAIALHESLYNNALAKLSDLGREESKA